MEAAVTAPQGACGPIENCGPESGDEAVSEEETEDCPERGEQIAEALDERIAQVGGSEGGMHIEMCRYCSTI